MDKPKNGLTAYQRSVLELLERKCGKAKSRFGVILHEHRSEKGALLRYGFVTQHRRSGSGPKHAWQITPAGIAHLHPERAGAPAQTTAQEPDAKPRQPCADCAELTVCDGARTTCDRCTRDDEAALSVLTAWRTENVPLGGRIFALVMLWIDETVVSIEDPRIAQLTDILGSIAGEMRAEDDLRTKPLAELVALRDAARTRLGMDADTEGTKR